MYFFLFLLRYLWIRLALYEKRLSKIIEHLVNNASNYYERDALVSNPDYGSILSSLLVGPCALEFTRTKTVDHYWSDPHADELVCYWIIIKNKIDALLFKILVSRSNGIE